VSDQTRILVIDREPEWREFVGDILRQNEYTVNLFNDLQLASRKIAENNFDLIIVEAPLLGRLKALAATLAAYRLLVVTSGPTVEEAINAYRSGALDYVHKAFGEVSFLMTVATVLQKPPAQPR
jgi:DNA-binding NtrC family response regulator